MQSEFVDIGLGEELAGGEVAFGTDGKPASFQGEAELVGGSLKDAHSLLGNLGTDPVAGDDRNRRHLRQPTCGNGLAVGLKLVRDWQWR